MTKIRLKKNVEERCPLFPYVGTLDLPRVTILTGINGTGKTQFLKAIADGKYIINENKNFSIQYYDPTNIIPDFSSSATSVDFSSFEDEVRRKVVFSKLESEARRVFPSDADSANFNPWSNGNFYSHIDRQKLNASELEGTASADAALEIALIELARTLKKFPHQLTNEEVEVHRKDILSDSITTGLNIVFRNYLQSRTDYVKQKVLGDERVLNRSEWYKIFDEEHEPPWAFINSVLDEIQHTALDDDQAFRFEITHPELTTSTIGAHHSTQPHFTTMIKLSDGEERNIADLSSGEKSIFAILLQLCQHTINSHKSYLYLLDEIDNSLHPQLAAYFIRLIEAVAKRGNFFFILSTHSVTTVAQAERASMLLFKHVGKKRTYEQCSKKVAIQNLSGGLATLDTAIRILENSGAGFATIVAEGHSHLIIDKALKENGILDVYVYPHAEDNSGWTQLKSLYHFSRCVDKSEEMIFLFDCDVKQYEADLNKPQNNTHYFIVPARDDGILASGIENAFSLKDVCSILGNKSESDKIANWNRKKKRDFAYKVASYANKEDLSHFNSLIEFIDKLRN